jgi:small-conductance mechanosensitive channel
MTQEEAIKKLGDALDAAAKNAEAETEMAAKVAVRLHALQLSVQLGTHQGYCHEHTVEGARTFEKYIEELRPADEKPADTWADRLKAEYDDLCAKKNALHRFLASKEAKNFNERDRAQLQTQYEVMEDYARILADRVGKL